MKKIIKISILTFILLVVSIKADELEMMYDDFETDFSKWSSSTGWVLDSTYSSSPSKSAMGDASSGILASNGVDLSDATSFIISFEYWVDDLDANDDIYIEFYNGATYDEIDEIGDDDEDTQLSWYMNVTNDAYFDNGFHIRIDGTSIDVNEALWIDDFNITKSYTPSAPNDPPEDPTLNAPDNGSIFDVNWVVLNYTAIDPDGNNMNCTIFGDTSNPPTTDINLSNNVANNSDVTFNWTSRSDDTEYFWRVNCTDGETYNWSGVRNFSINIADAPSVDTIVVNTTSTSNTTTDNVTLHITVSDADSDNVKNITDWRLNGTSIAILNVPFENNSGSFVTDYSTSDHTLTTGGSPVWGDTSGHDGWGGYTYDGDDYQRIESVSHGNQLTFMAWIKPTAFVQYGSMVANYDGTDGLLIDLGASDGQIRWRGICTSGFTLDESVPGIANWGGNSNWYHVAGTVNSSGTATLYWNGSILNTASGSGCSMNQVMVIGARNNSASIGNHFQGVISEVTVYNMSLTPTQIQTIYNEEYDKIVSQQTTLGDNWSACVTPIDATGLNGSEQCSENVTILSSSTCDCSSIQAGTPVDCTENCDISACDASSQDIDFTGSGTITISGDITNIGTTATIKDSCTVVCDGGCLVID